MSSLLLATQDVASAQAIEEIAAELGYRVRTVATPAAAQEWLSMQSFTVLLVDARYAGTTSMELLCSGWRHNPLLVGALFDLYNKVPDEWTARLVGAHVLSGSNALEEIRSCLRSAPEQLAFGESNYFAVLVVDDLDAPRDIISAYVESLGYRRVDAAASAAQCLEMLRSAPYDYFCVLSDISMPKVSGIELLAQIRSDPLLSWLPVVFLTAFSTSDNLVECIRAGATGFLTKPAKKPLLRAELEKAKRIVLHKRSPRLCKDDEAHLLEDALLKKGLG